MSIVNKRNAVIGWATWTTVKRLAAMKAKHAAPAREAKAPKGKKKKAVKAAAVILAAGGALAFWKAKHRDATDYDSIASEEIRVGGDAETTE
jgi:ferric-dicitrate binding protein FerR (iron transport regulator)